MVDFIDKVRHGFAQGVSTVSVKSKELVDAAKIKSQIGDLERRRKEALEELGNIAYTMFLGGTFVEDRLRARSTAIQELDGQIQSKQKELAEIHGRAQEALGKPKVITTCACGTEIYQGTKFCGKCGKKVEQLVINAGQAQG
jgi:hypothetical protein